ncbi:hypothetical protein, partial [uncultured Legionella sp.]|uniref:hypothetical protein n=1 Tax=uncultured Legionella sp. TaxID=210934 RepID=UPI002606670D
NSIIPLFKIIIENNRVDFGTAITEVFQGGVYYEPDKQAVIKLLLAKLSLKQLATHLPNLLQSFSDERNFNNDSISRKLVQTVSIFNKHHSEHLKEDIPTEIDQMIGALMVRSCSMT